MQALAVKRHYLFTGFADFKVVTVEETGTRYKSATGIYWFSVHCSGNYTGVAISTNKFSTVTTVDWRSTKDRTSLHLPGTDCTTMHTEYINFH